MSTNGRAPGRPPARRPLYARVLGLRYVRLSALMSFLLFECAIALASLLALAELVSWWAVAVLPLSIAAMVKLNDLVTGATRRAARSARIAERHSPVAPASAPDHGWDAPPARGRATVVPLAEQDAPAGAPRLTQVVEREATTQHTNLRRYRRTTDSAARRGSTSRHAANTTNERRFGRSA